MRDVVRNVVNRLGMVGVILLASALLFGALAGAIVVYRVETMPTASNESTQAGSAGEKSGKPKPTPSQHANQGPSNAGEADDSQDKDA